MNKTGFFLLLLAVASVSFFGCLKTPEPQPCTYDACAAKAPASEIAAVKAYIDSVGITGTTQHCSGLFYRIESAGTGITPEACSGVNARYIGRLTNGAIFDSTSRGLDFDLGGNIIAGWKNGVPLIKEGGRIQLFIPPALGFGSTPRRDANGNIVIPANAITIFEIGLVKVY